MDISGPIEAQVAQARQNVALSVIRSNAQQGQEIANILQESAETIAASTTRGTNVNIQV